MPSGFRQDVDEWLREYDVAKEMAQEVVVLIQERNMNPTASAEASRKTATARRKLGTLGTTVDKLMKWLDRPDAAKLSEQEKNRRRDLLYDLRNRREQMHYALKRNQAQADKDSLLVGASTSGKGAPVETERTAELDTRGLLQLQQNVMREQDTMLESMEKTVTSTKHIALAIGEEVDLHTRLLEDLEEDVDVTHTRMRAATARVKQVLKQSSHCKGGFFLFLLTIVLVVVCLVAFKIIRLFG